MVFVSSFRKIVVKTGAGVSGKIEAKSSGQASIFGGRFTSPAIARCGCGL
jgi:hypothetical protein